MKTLSCPIVPDLFQIFALLMQMNVEPSPAFRQCAYAIYLTVQDPDRARLPSKWLYPEVARHYGVSRIDVETNIQRVADSAWKGSAPLLRKMAEDMMMGQPDSEQFILLLAGHFLYFPHAT